MSTTCWDKIGVLYTLSIRTIITSTQSQAKHIFTSDLSAEPVEDCSFFTQGAQEPTETTEDYLLQRKSPSIANFCLISHKDQSECSEVVYTDVLFLVQCKVTTDAYFTKQSTIKMTDKHTLLSQSPL